MSSLNFDLPADFFWAKSARRVSPRGGVSHKRFDTLAEAICSAMENQDTPRYSVSIDTDETSLTMDEVDALYRSDDFAAYRKRYSAA
ncbi:hypothetical protein [Aurantimonas manganoxydans]|uniref:hypothetical protein n=1 Tax=Aurantimonas manganoxydans TaxID=651183 RepID=UPI0002F36526|nr:hypothetical protein [Aurantimonas manganoxydans]